jgi:hypothetical protein
LQAQDLKQTSTVLQNASHHDEQLFLFMPKDGAKVVFEKGAVAFELFVFELAIQTLLD